MTRRWTLIGLAALVVAAACNPRMPASHGRLRSEAAIADPFLAGAALVDITPPPGASMFGHGPGAGVAFGYWTRLQCRAYYLEPAQRAQEGFAIVACDLPNISTLLHRKVAEMVCPPLPAARLMLTATHTHAGPGHYTESENFGGKGSALFPGFDPAMVDFLAERIAGALEAARRRARPARLRWLSRELWGLTRNRSVLPYQSNRSPAAWKAPRWVAERGEAWKAIDPVLRVLQLQAIDDDSPSGAIGSLTLFAMHPTVVGNSNRYWGGDTFGVATRHVEAGMRTRTAHTKRDSCAKGCERSGLPAVAAEGGVHALLNTNEGDISPDWRLNSPSEAVRIGRLLGDAILGTLRVGREDEPSENLGDIRRTEWKSEPVLGIRYLEERLPGAPYFTRPAGAVERLCDRAELGLGSVRGATDHPSVFQALLAVEEPNADPERTGCQAPKRPFLGWIQGVSSGSWAFPEQVPLGLIRLDDTWISFLPAELTITAGARVNEAVLEIARRQVAQPDAVVAGLANGYILYVATPEEYQLQHYEGASTIYGPGTGPLFASRLNYLASHLACPTMESSPTTGATPARVDEAQAFSYKTGPERERFWRESRDVALSELRVQRKFQGLCTLPNTDPPGLCAWWVDGGPGAVHLDLGPWVEVVGCESKSEAPGTGALCPLKSTGVDDRGFFFHTRLHDPIEDGWLWATVFRPQRETWERLRHKTELRLRVRGDDRTGSVDSATFAAGALPCLCTSQQLRDVCAAPW